MKNSLSNQATMTTITATDTIFTIYIFFCFDIRKQMSIATTYFCLQTIVDYIIKYEEERWFIKPVGEYGAYY